MRLKGRFAIACALVVASMVAPARAHDIKRTTSGAPVRWASMEATFTAVRSGDKKKDELLDRALRGAAEAWREATGFDMRVDPLGAHDEAYGYDARNRNHSVIKWLDEDEWPYDKDMLALTFVRYETETGIIADADILINDAGFRWDDRKAGGREGYDLQNALTHEIGHALGLAHSEIDDATMFVTTSRDDLKKRDLARDDIEATRMLYDASGAAGANADATNANVGCQASRTTSNRGFTTLAASLVAFVLVRRRRRRRS